MIHRHLILLVCGLAILAVFTPGLVIANGSPAPAPFFSTLNDVPLMPGLQELPERSLSFDKPEGRIVEAFAAINAEHADPATIAAFYRRTLPQLGWEPASDMAFIRQDEQMTIRIGREDAYNILHIMIEPR